VDSDGRLPRREAARHSGLHTAVCFPVRSERGFLAAIEFFGAVLQPRDDRLVATMEDLGLQVGQLVERRRAEQAVAESEQTMRAVLEAALDCIVIIDHEGTILEFNPAAERVFGISAQTARGREMAEMIVPPELRERHRAGLRRCVAGEGSNLLGTRVETEGMRGDGCRFPVELTVTRIGIPGPPLFTGYLRDITERQRAEDELRASRARIVEAADAARRRIERDLHDGTQQRLITLALELRTIVGEVAPAQQDLLAKLSHVEDGLRGVLDELREISRGVHPAIVSEGGIGPALKSLVRRSGVPAELEVEAMDRLPEPVEIAAYYVVSEALANATKHANASVVRIRLESRDGTLRVAVHDDGLGGADPSKGSGIVGLIDRAEALGGSVTVASPAGAGTSIVVELPARQQSRTGRIVKQ
jgi:PAS domain S-box-containing protein